MNLWDNNIAKDAMNRAADNVDGSSEEKRKGVSEKIYKLDWEINNGFSETRL